MTGCADNAGSNPNSAPAVRWLHVFPGGDHVVLALLTDEGPSAYRIMRADVAVLIVKLMEAME